MTTDELVPCGHCHRSFRTDRGRAGHMAQKHPAEWDAEGIATGKAAERLYFRTRKRAHVAADPARYAGYTKRWREANREKVAATIAAWKGERPEHVGAYQAAWRDANREHTLEYAAERRLTGRASSPSDAARLRARRKAWARDIATGAAKARREVAKAVANGTLVKRPCEVCGADRSEGHHYLGYAPAHRLDVRWLCKEHHTEAHRPEAVARRRRVAARIAQAAA